MIVSQGKSTWESNLSLKAYAPKFSLEKVLINGVENGNLEKGKVVTLTAVVKNEGGADAYIVKGDIDINSQYVTLACENINNPSQNLSAGAGMELPFIVITNPDMPYGHNANIALHLTAKYELAATENFTATCSGSNTYCSSGSQTCTSNDKFTSVILYKTSVPATLLINNTSGTCSSGGYQDYTSTNVTLEPGQQYTIKVKCGYNTQQVGGWFDLNGNNTFDSNEKLITLTCGSANSEYTQTFTIPEDFVPGTSRFRLVCKFSGTPVACGNDSYGQTHDYSITLPELYAHVQNVVAVLEGSSIKVTWEAPEEGTPDGYNIYRSGTKLNSEPFTAPNFTEVDITNGVYAYNVTAVYGTKESFAEMSNVICNFAPLCIAPVELTAVVENNNAAVIKWEDSPEMEGTWLGYNIFRDGEQINTELWTEKTYTDENLAAGTYSYQVSAVYEACESELTDEVTVTILLCEKPTNLEGVAEKTTAIITWNEPENMEGTLLGYNIYRDGTLLNETTYTEMEYSEELENGTYVYQISAVYEHCESELTEGVSVKIDFTGVCEVSADSFQIFPNPVQGKLNITGSVTPNCIRIYNITGQLVYETTTCSTNMSISVSTMPTGIYFIKIDSANDSITRKLIFR
jgi:hypothetical protein